MTDIQAFDIMILFQFEFFQLFQSHVYRNDTHDTGNALFDEKSRLC